MKPEIRVDFNGRPRYHEVTKRHVKRLSQQIKDKIPLNRPQQILKDLLSAGF